MIDGCQPIGWLLIYMKISVIIPVYNQESLVIRAIKSVPARKDIEVIVVDDCSTDNTLDAVREYQMNACQNIVVLHNPKNKGVGFSINKGLDVATGEYIVLLGSDDYFTEGFNVVAEQLDCDLVYFDLEINSGEIWHLTDQTKWVCCGSVKFMKREFVGDIRNPEIRNGEDFYFFDQLQKKRPKEKFTGIVAKHYNFPRPNSLSWKVRNNEL